MIITVTEQHIKDGRRCLCQHCPIALAVSEATGLLASVGSSWITLRDEKTDIEVSRHLTPPRCQVFMRRFDQCWDVEPFTFVLDYEPSYEPTIDTDDKTLATGEGRGNSA